MSPSGSHTGLAGDDAIRVHVLSVAGVWKQPAGQAVCEGDAQRLGSQSCLSAFQGMASPFQEFQDILLRIELKDLAQLEPSDAAESGLFDMSDNDDEDPSQLQLSSQNCADSPRPAQYKRALQRSLATRDGLAHFYGSSP